MNGPENKILEGLSNTVSPVVVIVIDYSQLFQRSILIMDITTYRLNQPRGQCSENTIHSPGSLKKLFPIRFEPKR